MVTTLNNFILMEFHLIDRHMVDKMVGKSNDFSFDIHVMGQNRQKLPTIETCFQPIFKNMHSFIMYTLIQVGEFHIVVKQNGAKETLNHCVITSFR